MSGKTVQSVSKVSKAERRRIIQVSDSDSDNEASKYKNKSLNGLVTPIKQQVVAERERKLRYLMSLFPKLSMLEVCDELNGAGYELGDAIAELNQKNGNTVVVMDYEKWKLDEKLRMQQSNGNGKIRKAPCETKNVPKAKRRRAEAVEDSDSESDYNSNQVYDSDEDSDMEVSNNISVDQTRVLDFLSTGSCNELLMMHACSMKKVEALIAIRPFAGWKDLVRKLGTNKNLSTDLLNAAQKVVSMRNSMRILMNKCTRIAVQLERAIQQKHPIQDQPKLIPSGLRLTDYQMVGINWLAILHAQELNGILADEMGLGKTIQVVAFLGHLKELGIKGPHLIVVPASTLENWQNEFERWCPALKVMLYYGNTDERRAYRMMIASGQHKEYDVLLSTYTIVSGTPEERKMFRVTPMNYVVFDEAHMLKNMNTGRYETLSRVRANRRLLLTGTPLQNNLLELMSLLIFVMPNIFSAKTEDLKNLFQKNSKFNKEEMPTFEKEQIEQAKRIMKPFLLRRLKQDVLKYLPVKTDHKLVLPLINSQKKQYDDLVARFQEVGTNDESGSWNGMSMMSDLRKLANHPLLMRYHYTHDNITAMAKLLSKDPDHKDTVEQYIVNDLLCMSDFAINAMTKQYVSIGKFAMPKKLIPISGKFKYLDKKLPELKKGGHRVLIFSQYVIMLDILQEYLNIRKHSYLRLDGNTQVTLRQQLINEYTNDESIFIFLLSTRAGGLGINLTAADTVLIHDIDFNPYNDKQAEDRCHRMGQTRPVNVIRLVSQGTIEISMWDLTQQKLKLEREITTDDYDKTDVKGVVSLLSQALKLDQNKLENLVSPEKIRMNADF